MTRFLPGQLVKCIDARSAPLLRLGATYVVVDSYGSFVDVGVTDAPGPGFYAERFIACTDIAPLRELLTTTPAAPDTVPA